MLGTSAAGIVSKVEAGPVLYVISDDLADDLEQGPCRAVELPAPAVYAVGDRVLVMGLMGSSEPVVIGRLPA